MTSLQWAELEIALAHQIIPTLDLDDTHVIETVGILYSNLLVTRELAAEAEGTDRRPFGPPPVAINPSAKYLTAKEAALYLGMPYSSFRKVATDIRRAKTGRFTRDALDEWANRRR